MTVERAEAIGVYLVRVGAGRVRHAEQAVHQARDAERQNRVHVVPQFPLGQHAGRVALLAGAEPVGEVVEERVEVVVLDDEQAAIARLGVEQRDAAGHLHPHGRFAGPLFAKHDRRGRVGRVAVDLVPGGVVRGVAAPLLEHRVGLRILLGKRIDGDAVVLE